MSDITASGDWYFIHPISNTNKANIFPVAVWSRQANDEVIGLIGNVESKSTGGTYVRLVAPPPVEGMYIKRNPVNSDLIDQAIRDGDVDYYELREL